MPLRTTDRQPLQPNKIGNIKKDQKVFHLPATKEIFTNHSDYANRLLQLESRIWTCAVSFKKGLTFYEAQKSEEKLATKIAQLPIPIHKTLCCLVANFGAARIERLVDSSFEFFKYRYIIGEPIGVGVLRKNQKMKKVKRILFCSLVSILTFCAKWL